MSDYLQHGSRHRPQGSDPIPAADLQALGLPSAYYSKTIISPITAPAAALDLALDTVQTPNPEYFSVVSGVAHLATGFYMLRGSIQFQSVVDWSSLGGLASLAFTTSGIHTLDMETTIAIGSVTSQMNYVQASDFAYLTGDESFSLAFAAGNGSTTFPSGIARVRAAVVRISGEYSITP